MGKYMMATKAFHKLGDISSDTPDLCYIKHTSIDEKYYIGSWVTGFGFINVKFPKESTRELTDEEIKYWNSKYIQIASQPPHKLNVTEEKNETCNRS